MAEETKQLNLYEKLAKIGEAVKVMKKDKEGYGYKYVQEADILLRIQDGMKKHGVSLIPKIVPKTCSYEARDYAEVKQGKNDTTYEKWTRDIIVSGDMEYVWVNNENPEEQISVPWYFIGQQAESSQALGSGLSYANRYFLLRYFGIATGDDPDQLYKKKKEAEAAEQKEICKDILTTIDTKIKEYLSTDKADKASVMKIVEKHAIDKSGKPSTNYNLITDPNIAKSLSDDLTEFIKKEFIKKGSKK